MFKAIDDLKKKLDLHRPFSPITIKNLSEDIILRWTYHSNAIEGNRLTLLETKVVLEGIAVGGKTLKDHFEAINHRNAVYYVEDIIRKEEPFSEWQIRNIHQLIILYIMPSLKVLRSCIHCVKDKLLQFIMVSIRGI